MNACFDHGSTYPPSFQNSVLSLISRRSLPTHHGPRVHGDMDDPRFHYNLNVDALDQGNGPFYPSLFLLLSCYLVKSLKKDTVSCNRVQFVGLALAKSIEVKGLV